MSFTDYAANFLSSLLLTYSEELTQNAVKLSQTKTRIKIEDTDLYSLSFLQHGYPIIIKKGLIGAIEIDFPQSNVFTEQSFINISDIYIHSNFIAAEGSSFPKYEELKAMRDHQQSAHNIFKSKFLPIFKKFLNKRFNNKIQQILSHAIVEVKNIYVSIDFGEGDKSFYLLIKVGSILLSDIEDKVSHPGSESEILERKMTIKDFSVNIGNNNNLVDYYCGDTFKSKILERQNQQFIINTIDVEGVLSYDPTIPKLSTTLNHHQIDINLEVWQLQAFKGLIPRMRTFKNYWQIRNIPRPENPDDLIDSWIFVNRCAFELNIRKKAGNAFSRFMRAYKDQRSYFRIILSSNGRRGVSTPLPEIERLERSLSYQQTILFRYMSDILSKKWTKKSLSLSEMNEAFQFCEDDPDSLMSFFNQNSFIKFEYGKAAVNVKVNDLLLSLNLHKPSFDIRHIESAISYHLTFSSFSFLISSPQYSYPFFESVDRGMMNFDFSMKKLRKDEKFNFSLRANIKGELFSINMTGLHQFPRHLQLMNLENIFNFGSFFKNVDVNIKINSAQVQFQIVKGLFFNLVFETFMIYRDDSDNFKMSLIEGSIMLGREIERVITTSLSADLIYLDNHKMLLFISPLFMNLNWKDIINLKEAVSGMGGILFDGLFELPGQKRTFQGGIPSLKIAVDFPTMKTLQYVNIDTVKFEGQFPNFAISMNCKDITADKIFSLKGISYKRGKNIEEEILIERLDICLLQVISYLPANFLDIFALKPFSKSISFNLNEVNLDFSLQQNQSSIVLFLSKINGLIDDGTMSLKGNLKSADINKQTAMTMCPFTSTATRNEKFDIITEFGDVSLTAFRTLIPFILNTEWPVNQVFLNDLELNFVFQFDSISIENYVQMKGIECHMAMSANFLGGNLSIKKMNFLNMRSEDKHVFSMSFDLSRHFFSFVFNYDEIYIDAFRFLSTLQYLMHYPFHVTVPLTLEVKIMPSTFHLEFGKDIISINLDTYFYFDGSAVEIMTTLNNFDIYLNDRRICEIKYMEINGIRQLDVYSPEILLQVSSLELLTLNKLIKKIPKLDFKMWKSSHNFNLPLSFDVEEFNFVLNNAISLHLFNSLISLADKEIRFDSTFSIHLIESWFEAVEIIQPTNFTIVGNLAKNDYQFGMNEDLRISLRPSLLSLQGKLNFCEEPIIVVQNNTDFTLTVDQLGNIEPRKSLTSKNYPFVDTMAISCDLGEIPFKPENFANGGNMQVIFNTGQTFILEIQDHILVVSSLFEVQNRTEHEFTFAYREFSLRLNANDVVHTQQVANEFRLDNLDIRTQPRKQVIRFDDRRIHLMVTISSRRIVIEPLFVLDNRMPFDLVVNDNQIFKANSVREFDLFAEEFVTVKAYFLREKRVKVDFSMKFITEKFTTIDDDQFFVRIQNLIEEGITRIVVSPNAIFHNHTTNRTFVISTDTVKRASFLESFAYSPKRKFYSTVFIGTLNGGDLSQFTISEEMSNNKDIKSNSNNKQLLQVMSKDGGNSSSIIPAIISEEIERLPYFDIIHVHFYPLATVQNLTNEKVKIKTGALHFSINPNQVVEIPEVDSSFDYQIQVGRSEKSPFFNFYLNHSRKIYLYLKPIYLPVLIENIPNENEESAHIIRISISESFPYRIQNATWLTVDVYEKDKRCEIMPNSSRLIAFEDPNSKVKFHLREIDLNIEFNQAQPIESFSKDGFQFTLIHITDDLAEIRIVEEVNPFMNKTRLTFGFYANTATINIYANDEVKTITKETERDHNCLTMKTYNFSFVVKQIGETKTFTMILDGLKLTDFRNRSLLNSLEYNLLKMSIEFSGYHRMKKFYFELLPFYFCFDLPIFSYFFEFFRHAANLKYVRSNSVGIDSTNNQLMNEHYYIEDFKLIFSSFSIAFQCNTKMSEEFRQTWRFLPEILPTDIRPNSFEMKNLEFDFTSPFSNSNALFKKKLMDKVNLLPVCLRLVGSMSCIGAPLNYVHRVFKTENLALKQKIGSFVGVPIGILESLIDYTSSVLRLVGHSEVNPKDSNSPVLWGFTSMFFALFSGIVLFLKAPGVGFKKGGLMGMVVGIILGGFDLLANCGAGALDCLSGLLCFLRSVVAESLVDDDFTSPLDQLNQMNQLS